jgi:sulfoxide reductase catalytic subunit YedY
MLIKLPPSSVCREHEVTPEPVYLSRRRLMQGALLGVASSALPGTGWAQYPDVEPAIAPPWLQRRLADVQWAPSSAEPVAPFKVASQYNNFYEFGPGKTDPARHAAEMKTEPWSVRIDGLVARPGVYDLDQLCAQSRLQERIYRLRCVEAWSMVIPWLGFPLAELIRRVEPLGDARYVRFETLHRPEEMPGARSRFSLIDWPYVEGLRLDEAMHPLTILAVGMYGRVLPNQNGAPLRLVVPWKYGFKSIKSIVRISFVSEQPQSSWMRIAPHEYGFYANVNPEVSHPRWSQAQERRLPNTLFSPNLIPTRLFNGYAEEVAELYRGMDLRKYY